MKRCGRAIGMVLWARWRAEDFSVAIVRRPFGRQLRLARGKRNLLH
jgi:hypothetical protein